MTTTERDVLNYVNNRALQFDSLAEEIYNTYDLFRMEIEDECASVQHEAELCISEIEDLIDEYKSNTTANR
tara:strand:+ start:1050 stop:1262 length:213 start_codon:yes stop_codon:yes gene_type:complete